MHAGLDRESLTQGTLPRGISRVGLVGGLTGVPLVVLFLRQAKSAFHCELRSLEKVETLRGQASEPSDSVAWGYVESFFQSGGTRAHVLALPFPGKNRLHGMLGADKGLSRRTGIQCVRDWAEKADLLSIPQAPELLEGEEFLGFTQAVLDLTGAELGMLYLLDLPKAFSADEAEAFVRPLFCPDAAVFHPWLICAGKVVPPSLLAAAWLQRADAEVGIQEIAGQLPIGGDSVPMVSVAPQVRTRLVENRINTFLRHAGETRVWGGYTLADSADWKSRLIPLRRSSLKIQEAVEQICEPYVLEPAGPELSVWVENSLQNFLRSVRKVFHRDLQQPFSTTVQIVEQAGEERIQVGLSYALPHSLEKFSLSFVA